MVRIDGDNIKADKAQSFCRDWEHKNSQSRIFLVSGGFLEGVETIGNTRFLLRWSIKYGKMVTR